MEKFNLLTKTGAYWHFHPIGTGTVFTYHTKAKQVLITCSATGRMINTIDKGHEGGYDTPEEFKKAAMEIYMMMIEDEACNSMDLDFYPDPTYVGNSMVEVDFNIMKN